MILKIYKFLVINVFILVLLIYNTKCDKKKANKIFYFEDEKFLVWKDAFSYCKNMSMNLFTVRTQDEFDFLKDIIQSRYDRLWPYWMGAYKIEGTYHWLDTGENIQMFFWHMGEPNDKSGHEKCIHTWEKYFDWNDNDCEVKLPFICEREVELN